MLYYQKQASETEWVTVLHFLTTGTSNLSHDDWDKMAKGQLSMALADWATINKMISNFCSAPQIDCNYEVSPGQSFRQVMNGFFERIGTASGHSFRKI